MCGSSRFSRSVVSSLCSDVGSEVSNSELRHTNCELSFAKEIWLGNNEEIGKELQNGSI